MNKPAYTLQDDNLIYHNPQCLSLDLTLDCGQAFRWKKLNNGHWSGISNNKYIELTQNKPYGDITFFNTSEKTFISYWINYFDLERNYNSICDTLKLDSNIKNAINEFYGIHILNQEPWEALCSFIISQNNNIPRIQGIIERLCQNFGEELNINNQTFYTFPSAQTLATLSIDDLSPIRAGFRNKYIIDAANKVTSGEIDLEQIKTYPLDMAENELKKINGVGPKVAQCTLLYGLGKIDAFPVDVWVKRIMSEMYPQGLPECTNGIRGIAQQYLFHWRRNSPTWQNNKTQ